MFELYLSKADVQFTYSFSTYSSFVHPFKSGHASYLCAHYFTMSSLDIFCTHQLFLSVRSTSYDLNNPKVPFCNQRIYSSKHLNTRRQCSETAVLTDHEKTRRKLSVNASFYTDFCVAYMA